MGRSEAGSLKLAQRCNTRGCKVHKTNDVTTTQLAAIARANVVHPISFRGCKFVRRSAQGHFPSMFSKPWRLRYRMCFPPFTVGSGDSVLTVRWVATTRSMGPLPLEMPICGKRRACGSTSCRHCTCQCIHLWLGAAAGIPYHTNEHHKVDLWMVAAQPRNFPCLTSGPRRGYRHGTRLSPPMPDRGGGLVISWRDM